MQPRGHEHIWTEYGKTWAEFCKEPLDTIGLLIEVRHEVCYHETVEEFLIGDINAMGGTCDDCAAVKRDSIVLRYRRVYGG